MSTAITRYRYEPERTGLLLVDPYNDFFSEGGKMWPFVKEVAEAVRLHDHLREILAVVRSARIQVFVVPHHRWCREDATGWRHLNPDQIGAREMEVFGKDTWGGEWYPEFAPQPGDIVIQEHWAQNGFANTDLAVQLQQHGIENVICVGMLANSCIEATGRFAMELGYHVTLVTDATAAFSLDRMHAAHELNGPTFAHAIVTTKTLIDLLRQSAAHPVQPAPSG
ncbi:MAG: isochorismatase family cysteine hydrolase [Armatimonadota bacterium]